MCRAKPAVERRKIIKMKAWARESQKKKERVFATTAAYPSAHSVGTIENSLTFEKLSEALQGLLSFPLLTGINVLTAVVGWGQGKASAGSLWSIKKNSLIYSPIQLYHLIFCVKLYNILLRKNRPICGSTFRVDVAIVTEKRSRFVYSMCLCVGILNIHLSPDPEIL